MLVKNEALVGCNILELLRQFGVWFSASIVVVWLSKTISSVAGNSERQVRLCFMGDELLETSESFSL